MLRRVFSPRQTSLRLTDWGDLFYRRLRQTACCPIARLPRRTNLIQRRRCWRRPLKTHHLGLTVRKPFLVRRSRLPLLDLTPQAEVRAVKANASWKRIAAKGAR